MLPERSLSSGDLRYIAGGWSIAGLIGVLSVIAGIIVIAEPSNSLATLAVVSGIFILIDGIVAIVESLGRGVESRGLVAVIGVVSVIVGIVLIRHPLAGVAAVALVLGLWLIAAAAVRALVAFAMSEHRPRRLAAAAVLAIAGIVVVSSPRIGYATLAVVVGIGFIAYGFAMIILGVALRTVGHVERAHGSRGAVGA